ncbi:putative two-component system response regulator [Azospirillaceae bacterium]
MNTPRDPAFDKRSPLLFGSRPSASASLRLQRHEPWKIMIADDEEDVHSVSRMLLKDFSFDGRGVRFISAHSGAETRKLIQENPDTAILLLDVVMESEHAGLDVVRYIREDLKNSFVRVILRTGQPGQAPEKQVVEDYDINDYKEKTELTAQKLVTAVMSALRAYRDIRNLESSRKGLEQIIEASNTLFEPQSIQRFTQGVLTQLTSLLNLSQDSLFIKSPAGCLASGIAATRTNQSYVVMAATGQFTEGLGLPLVDAVSSDLYQKLMTTVRKQQTYIGGQDFIGFFRASSGAESLIYLQSFKPFDDLKGSLLRVFSANLGVAFDNICLHREISDTQAELIQTLSEVIETRSLETSQHTLRVGRVAHLLAQKIGMSDADAELIRIVAPMHDLGKVGIPDAILNKPGPLTPEEFACVKTHTVIGHAILKGSPRRILRTAALVSLQHHEHWIGTGYPHGLKGEEIDLMGRIVCLADVFDAVSHNRPYKAAWPTEQVHDYISRERGRQFDPALADIMLEAFDEFVQVRSLA